ncbi:hypothetical protein CEUSTIGMA_g9878.t1, partial [Chlamydomonas eustigma]
MNVVDIMNMSDEEEEEQISNVHMEQDIPPDVLLVLPTATSQTLHHRRNSDGSGGDEDGRRVRSRIEEEPTTQRRSGRVHQPPSEWWRAKGLLVVEEPDTITEAMDSPQAEEWRLAMTEEMASLMKNGTWKLVNCLLGVTPVPVKRSGAATTRCQDSFSQRSVGGGDLYGPAPGFEEGGKNVVCKLEKALYGLKQAPRAWHTKLRKELELLGFTASEADAGLFVRCGKQRSDNVYLLVYVDDCLLITSKDNKSSLLNLKSQLASIFDIHDMGEAKFFLGMEIERNCEKGTLVLSQRHFTEELLNKYSMIESKGKSVPMSTALKLQRDGLTKPTPTWIFFNRMRPALWSGGDSPTLISQLYGKPRLPRQDVHRLNYVKAPSTRHKLYPQRAVESSELGSFAVFFNHAMARLLTGMRDPSIYQDGTYVVELEPSAPHFAELFHGLSHGSAFPVTYWGPHGVVSVPVKQVDKPYPVGIVGTVEILVRDIPVDLQTEAFGEALLSLAGYKVLYPSSTTDPLYPAPRDKTTVYLLGSRWGDNPAGFTHRYNPSICILSLFPHPTDPALHRLPTKLSGPGISPHISCLLRNDPLHPRLHVSPHHPTSGVPETESLPAGWKTSPNNYNNSFTKGALVSYNKSDGTTRQAYILNVDNSASPPQFEIRCVGDTDPSHHIFTIAERLAKAHQPAYVVKAGCARGNKQVTPRHTDPMVVDSHPLTQQIPMADPLLLKNCFASLGNLSLATGHDMEVDEPFLPCPPLPFTTAAKAKQEMHRLGRSDATSWRRVVSEASNARTGALSSQQIDLSPKVSLVSLNGTSAPLPGGAGRNALFHSPMVSGIPKTFVTAAPFPGGVERPLGTTVSKPCST